MTRVCAVTMLHKKVLLMLWLIAVNMGATAEDHKVSGALGSDDASVVLTDFTGNRRAIDEFTGNGKWLVVMIWALDCAICNTEVKQYMAFHDAHRGKDASVLGLSMDGVSHFQQAQFFLARHEVNFPSLIGEGEAVTRLYAQLTGEFLAGTPAFLVYAPSGELAAKQIGAVPVDLNENFVAQQGR